MKQTSFSFFQNYKKEFGGSLLLGKRKEKRPLSTKNPIHLVLKSDEKASFHPCNQEMKNLIQDTASEFGIKIYDLALNWNHIHCLMKIPSRDSYVKFIRALTSRMKVKFILRPFTRILSWGRDFKNALNYLLKNKMEAFGLKREPKKKKQPG